MFLPQRTAATAALEQFIPNAGADYAAGRNYDPGANQRGSASRLSPWIRTRMLPEWEVTSAVLEQHGAAAACKYIDEVCWRTYWKGWMQLRPSVWKEYLAARETLLEKFVDNVGYRKAIDANTGIDCFDAWVNELIETNHLHNHARMWFASIWVHTLKLPWELGADLFLRNLLDGDTASNTLSWRWVAGLHTAGKAYLASNDNIRRYTRERFPTSATLAREPVHIESKPVPQPQGLKVPTSPPSEMRLGLLVTEEDLSSVHWIPAKHTVIANCGYFPRTAYDELSIAEPVTHFRLQALTETCGRAPFESLEAVRTWVEEHAIEGLVLAETPVGHWDEVLGELKATSPVPVYTIRHWWDELMHPYATHGFFRFKKAIPKAIAALKGAHSTSS